ncbi:hypothetical protein P3T39_002714 [Kitasatospora sp. GP82]|nr:hypothetical protein [Kitasatospora sp. GP82]
MFDHRWRDDEGGEWVLAVGRGPAGEWVLDAGSPRWQETLPFQGAEKVGEFAQAVLDLPVEPEPYEWELTLSEPHPSSNGSVLVATLTIGRDGADAHLPYLLYQSYYTFPLRPDATGLGLEVLCEGAAAGVSRLHAGAAALAAKARSGERSSARVKR